MAAGLKTLLQVLIFFSMLDFFRDGKRTAIAIPRLPLCPSALLTMAGECRDADLTRCGDPPRRAPVPRACGAQNAPAARARRGNTFLVTPTGSGHHLEFTFFLLVCGSATENRGEPRAKSAWLKTDSASQGVHYECIGNFKFIADDFLRNRKHSFLPLDASNSFRPQQILSLLPPHQCGMGNTKRVYLPSPITLDL